MRTILVVTVARSDFGIYLPTLKRLKEDKDINYFTLIWWICISIWLNLLGNAMGILQYKDILNKKLLYK